MPLTKEQQLVVDTLAKPEVSLVLTPACAGSGKTHTLVDLAKQLNPSEGIYLAYNKAIAQEATEKFKGTTIKCLTTHSLAYQAVVRQYGLRIGWFNPRDVTTANANYEDKKTIVRVLENFLVSSYPFPEEYLTSIKASDFVTDAVLTHLNAMAEGTIPCTHNFYLKMYQALLATGVLPPPKTGLLLLDEAGDINPVTLDIFRRIDSPKKIAVGDSKQNIYSFNGTVNGFTELASEGVTVPLTKSFRVSTYIASKIEGFVNKELDPDFVFTGSDYPKNTPIETSAYIARNNSGLVTHMFDLKDSNICFNTTRKIQHILELPLLLANLSNGKKIEDHKYKHIERLRALHARTPSLHRMSVTAYISKTLKDDEETTRALDVVKHHGASELKALAAYVTKCATSKHPLTLSTAHSSKG